ncbi:ABC-type histidine transport system ATPase subunit [Methylopila capsulata]|uniref:ABC-type histidine transport system ATPase subunit n=1 Tax=Methylopila capsulata TaxID=61654 RepID=A0A9W6IVZ8_9HYPH|nr:amino acid ABC transporter ATP-binding protein [Methylopila capsulata]MBM7852405.1 ABC-type histidine transport system ATPase subunit [Methylopila capsulata]GLK56614.1 arginine ABC transporter ATP-binding protein [Methylopila capsulata]
MTDTPLLAVEDLRKSFGSLEVLKGASFTVRPSEVIGLLGRSGSGKSTLLRCLNMLETPTGGRVLLDGEEIGFKTDPSGRRRALSGAEVARQRARMSMVFQQFNLWPHRTALGNVIEGPIQVLGVPPEQARTEGLALLDRVGLLAKADVHPIRLSGGQQQRVAIARALAMRPKIMLFDEPTSALDPELVAEVLQVMLDLAKTGTTMVVVTHEMAFARDACDTVMLLESGEIIERGPPDQVMSRPSDERARQFFGGRRPNAGAAA